MFNKLEGDSVLLRYRGAYRPCDLYTFQGGIFAKNGSSYIRLRADGTTSQDGVFFVYLEYEGPLFKDRFGRLSHCLKDGYSALFIQTSEDKQLLVAA